MKRTANATRRKDSASIYTRLADAKPCPTCYAPLERVAGGWICVGFGAHQFGVKAA